MSERGVHRRLAAILAADVVGYSRLMGEDEAGTLDVLWAHRKELIEPKIAEHDGRIVKLIGDGLLAEFPSAVEAVQCAVEIQDTIGERNTDVREDRQVTYRIGINIGDIVAEDDDIFGDGVNVAARLEGLAEPGGIAVSGAVREELGGKLALAFADGGLQRVKNIARSVHVWRWSPGMGVDVAGSAGVAVTVPDRPSIAVLPFSHKRAHTRQELFSDGITEDITTALSKLKGFLVIARNTTFTYKGRSVDVREVGRELGVRYVLEGSVRTAGDRVRVTAQLIDAATGNHLWAERYDRRLDDIFAIQDEITTSVVGCIGTELLAAEHVRIRRRPPQSLDAWECTIRALFLCAQLSNEASQKALALLERALRLDPSYAQPLGVKAFITVWRGFQG